jgi:hypothetical protein
VSSLVDGWSAARSPKSRRPKRRGGDRVDQARVGGLGALRSRRRDDGDLDMRAATVLAGRTSEEDGGPGPGMPRRWPQPSGTTGKTMAAEAVADALEAGLPPDRTVPGRFEVHRRDEKNLAAAVDEAVRAGAVLFFDEAYARLGKRSRSRTRTTATRTWRSTTCCSESRRSRGLSSSPATGRPRSTKRSAAAPLSGRRLLRGPPTHDVSQNEPDHFGHIVGLESQRELVTLVRAHRPIQGRHPSPACTPTRRSWRHRSPVRSALQRARRCDSRGRGGRVRRPGWCAARR